MTEQPIRLDFFPSTEEVAVGKRLKVTFRYPDTDHPIYGKAVDLEGEVDLIIPQGSYPISNFYQMGATEQDELLENYVRRLRKLHEDLDDIEMKSRFRDWLVTCCLVCPLEDARSDLFKSISNVFAIVFHIDDLADDEEMMHEIGLTTSAIYRCYPSWAGIFTTGDTKYYEELVLRFPLLKTGFDHMTTTLEDTIKMDPGLRLRLKYMHRSFFESAETVPLVTIDMECEGETLSEESMKLVRGLNAGFQIALEYIAALQGIELCEKVRQSLLFEIFINGYNLGSGLFNDIFGLNKDVAKSASTDNCILRRVVGEGMSLKAALEKTLKLLRDTTNDTRLAGKKLIEAFPGEESVAKFVRTAEIIYDGQILSYLLLFKLKGRYGSIGFQIVAQD